MLIKTKMVLAAALVLSLASAAQAGGRDDADSSGGYRFGPNGQAFDGVNPAIHRPLRTEFAGQVGAVYGYAAAPHQSSHKKAKTH